MAKRVAICKTVGMPGVYLLVAPVDKKSTLLVSCPQIPHITLLHSPDARDLSRFKLRTTLEWIGETFTVTGTTQSVFINRDGVEVHDTLLTLDADSIARIETMRDVYGELQPHWNIRAPHITHCRRYGPVHADIQEQVHKSVVPERIKVIGIACELA